MKKLKRIPLGILNITATPHDGEGLTYINLFNSARDLKGAIRIKGDEFAIIASFVLLNEHEPLSGGFGEIHKYTDLKGDWENTLLRKKASENDLKELNIPDHLRPNRESFRYFLFPREHRLVFQRKGEKRSISQSAVKKLLDGLFASRTIKEQWPLVNVIIEQEPSSWQRIIDMPHLNKLIIEISARPNTGDNFTVEEEEFVEKLLIDQGAKSIKVELNHAPGTSVKPDETNRKLGRVATKHGKAIGQGRDNQNRPVKIDTSEHPIEEPFDYNRKAEESLFDQMLLAAKNLVNRALGREQVQTHLKEADGSGQESGE